MTSLLSSSACTFGQGTITGSSMLDGVNYTQKFYEQQNETSIFMESTQIQQTTEDLCVSDNVNKFLKYIKEGKEDKAIKAYNDLIAEMKLQPRYSQTIRTNADGEEDITSLQKVAKAIIEQTLREQTGDENIDLNEYIIDNTADVTERHKQQDRYSWSNVKIDEHTTEDLLEQVCGEIDVDRTDKTYGIGSFFRGFVAAWNGIFNPNAGEI